MSVVENDYGVVETEHGKVEKFQWRPVNRIVIALYDCPAGRSGIEGNSDVKVLQLQKYDQIEVAYEYLEIGCPNKAIWYLGTVMSRYSFPTTPPLGLIPVSYVAEMSSRDLTVNEESKCLTDVISLCYAWPQLIKDKLSAEMDLTNGVNEIERHLGILERQIELVKNAADILTANYDKVTKQDCQKLGTIVDNFNGYLGFEHILPRHEDGSIRKECGYMNDYHSALLKRDKRLHQQSQFHGKQWVKLMSKKCFLFLRLKTLKFKATSPLNYWLRVTLYVEEWSNKEPNRPSNIKHEPFMIPIEVTCNNEKGDFVFESDKHMASLKDVSCLFENLEMASTDKKIQIFCDLMVEKDNFETIATSNSPVFPLSKEAIDNLLSDPEVKQINGLNEFKLVPVAQEEVVKQRKFTINSVPPVLHTTATFSGTFETHFVIGDEKKARKLLNLSSGLPTEHLSYQISRPFSSKHPSQLGVHQNEAFLRLRKLFLPKKDKERRIFIVIQLMQVQEQGLKPITDSMRLGTRDGFRQKFVSPVILVPKGKQEIPIVNYDLIKFDLKDHDPQTLLIHFTVLRADKAQLPTSDSFDKDDKSKEFEFFLPITKSLMENSVVYANDIYTLQAFNSVKTLTTQSLKRLNPLATPKVNEKKKSSGSGPAQSPSFGLEVKPLEDKLEIGFHVTTTRTSACQQVLNHLTCTGDEKFYFTQTSQLKESSFFDSVLWVLPQVLLKTMNHLSKVDNQTGEWIQCGETNALTFFVALFEQLKTKLDKTLYQSYVYFLTSSQGGFLNMMENNTIWKWFMQQILKSFERLVDERAVQKTGDLTSSDITPNPVTRDVLSNEKKFFQCAFFLWPCIKQSLSLDIIQGNKNSLSVFTGYCQKLKILMAVKVHLIDEEESKIVAELITHAYLQFPVFCDGLKEIRRLNLQLSCLTLCYGSKYLYNTRHRNEFHKIVEKILGHVVHVSSALEKYYMMFSFFLQTLVQFYCDNVNQESFKFNVKDVEFILVVYENVKSWLIVYENKKLWSDQGKEDEKEAEDMMQSCFRILSSAVQAIQLLASLDLLDLVRGEVSDVAHIVCQILERSYDVLEFSANNLPDEYFMMKIHISLEVYKFLYQENSATTSVFKLLLQKSCSPENSGDQFTYVFQNLLKVCHSLICSDHFRLESFSIVKQNLIRSSFKSAAQPDKENIDDLVSRFLDMRHGLAYLMKSLHDSILWPTITNTSPYPLPDILQMSLASPEGYTLSTLCEILADVYCLMARTDPQAYSELIKWVDTFIGFKHKMGDQLYVDRFKLKLIERIKSLPEIEEKKRETEKEKIESITSIQMKDLLNIRSAAESGLDPDLQVLYYSDLLKFYAGDKLYKPVGDLSSNVLFIRYHMKLYLLNVQFGNLTNAAETLMEFFSLLERLDAKNPVGRPNKVDHLKDEVPAEFYKPDFTTIEMSIEILKTAATLYEKQKLYEAADYARYQLSNFYYRNLDYEGLAANMIHRADLACKIKFISFEDKVKEHLPNKNSQTQTMGDKKKMSNRRMSTPAPEMMQTSQNVKMINTRAFNLKFYVVRFPKNEAGVNLPKVFEGKSFIYSRENLMPNAFETYLKSVFSSMGNLKIVKETEANAKYCPGEIVYSTLTPVLMLPKRFKTQVFLPSSDPAVDFFRTHSITHFEKQIRVEMLDKMKNIEFSDEAGLYMMPPTEREEIDPVRRQKKIDEWKKELKKVACYGIKVTKYKMSEQNLVVQRAESESYPGKCRWQTISMVKPPVEHFSHIDFRDDMIEFIQKLCGIYFEYQLAQQEPKDPQRQLESLSQFPEIYTKLSSPIQGGLKKQQKVYHSEQYKSIVTEKEVKSGFTIYYVNLIGILKVVAHVCKEFIEANKECDEFAVKLNYLSTVVEEFDRSFVEDFKTDRYQPLDINQHSSFMNEMKEFVKGVHLNRILKNDPCIQDQQHRSFPRDDFVCSSCSNGRNRRDSDFDSIPEGIIGEQLEKFGHFIEK